MIGLLLPYIFIGSGYAMVYSSAMPMMGHLIDIRHSSVYGNVYAISDAANCLGYFLGLFLIQSIELSPIDLKFKNFDIC
jgi:DHA1 family solute carrier family 18 vesicular amine transporter 1/2